MEIENRRGCIISGPFPGKRLEEKKTAEHKAEPRVDKLSGGPARIKKRAAFNARGLMKELRAIVGTRTKKLAAATAGAAVCALGLGALGAYCTVGIDYYSGGRLLCTVAAADDSAAIIGAAAQRADILGVDEPEIEVSAKLALKKNIVNGEDAVNAILAASPELCLGCALCVDGQSLFVAQDKAVIDKALKEYTDKYSMGGDAHLSADFTVEEQIVRREEVTPEENIVALLESSNTIAVVDATHEVETDPIPYETSEIPDDTMYMGDVEVVTPGVNGALKTTVENVYSNGELLSAAILSAETVAEPVTQVVRVGTKLRNALEDGFSYPISGGRLSSGFGARWGRQHKGVDLAVASGTAVCAAAAGTVITAKYNESYGNYVQIDHGYGIVTTYAHLSSIAVETGQTVNRGQLIAYSGSTGNSTGPHLHFEVIDNGNYLNPLEHMI